jgi:phosphonate transport system substrate-binding protein
VVRRDSEVRSFADLRGASWAYNERLSHSGYGITRYHLVELGETRGFFGRVVEAGFHEKAIQMVVNGTVDATAIDSQVLEVAMRDDPTLLEELRVIDTLWPSTIQPVAVSEHVPESLRTQILETVVTLHRDPALRSRLQLGLVDRFVRVDPSSCEDIRTMLETCEAADFMEIR